MLPVYKRILADLLTPISIYMRLARDEKYSFILESAEQGKINGRYSYIGIDPQLIIKSENNKTAIFRDGGWSLRSNPFIAEIRKIQKKYTSPSITEISGFTGGLVGYMGYESIKWVEEIPIYEYDELQCPDAIFMLFKDIVAFDHLKNHIILISNVYIDESIDLDMAYQQANNRIDKLGAGLHTDIDYQVPLHLKQSELQSNFTKTNFLSAVEQVKEYINSGDVFQLVISQRFNSNLSLIHQISGQLDELYKVRPIDELVHWSEENVKDLFNNHMLDSVKIITIPLNEDDDYIFSSTIKGIINSDDKQRLVVQAANIGSKKTYSAFNVGDSFSINNVEPGHYIVWAYSMDGIVDSVRYFSGTIIPYKPSSKFIFCKDTIEVRKNWDVDGVVLDFEEE